MTSRLENRYRVLLRALPEWYRAEREQEMLAVWLAERTDELDLEYGWPGWAETRSLLGLALRTRLSGPPRSAALGDAVRLVALIGLLVQVGLGTAYAVNIVLSPVADLLALVLDLLLAVGSVGALASLATGRRVQGLVLGLVALVPSLLGLASHPALWAIANALPEWATALCLVLGYHREAPLPKARPWLTATALASGLGAAWWGALSLLPRDGSALWVQVDLGVAPGWALSLAGLVLLVRPRPAARLAVAASLLLLLPERLVLLSQFSVVLPQAVTMAVLAMALGVAGLRDLRRLPGTPPALA
ncbi:hypothetical protein GCM10010174_01980 [Kutzneria viridogrisea]|uniref:Uncharacterized protein n=2 Tax=Kutzneria viridogrisea TaxID=47990 RepID=A0ABR6BCW2_9PSEU|nr:hypothetical protein [Kutzneria viridogrisea]